MFWNLTLNHKTYRSKTISCQIKNISPMFEKKLSEMFYKIVLVYLLNSLDHQPIFKRMGFNFVHLRFFVRYQKNIFKNFTKTKFIDFHIHIYFLLLKVGFWQLHSPLITLSLILLERSADNLQLNRSTTSVLVLQLYYRE